MSMYRCGICGKPQLQSKAFDGSGIVLCCGKMQKIENLEEYDDCEKKISPPPKTWVDEMAHEYAKIYLEWCLQSPTPLLDRYYDDVDGIAKKSYNLSEAMLAEKLRREKKASEHKHQQEEK